MVSLRDVNHHAAWCSNYEFEDTICAVDSVDLLTLTPGAAHQPREWLARRMVWRRGLRELTRYFSPGVQTIALKRDYDLFVYICMTPADLLYLAAVEGWETRCRIKICFLGEFYAGWAREYEFH